MKKLSIAILPLVAFSLNTVTHAATSDGKTFGVSAGWLHVMPQSSGQGVYGKTGNSPLLGAMANLQAANPDAGFEVQDADTAGLMLDYFVNDNVSLELTLGVPPEMELAGKGAIKLGNETILDLNQFDKAATTDAYTPTISARYHFGSINNKIRPYVGAGLMYAHFSNVETDSAINDALKATKLAPFNPQLGKVKVDDAVAPVAMLGIDYSINKNWYATASVSYAHLTTKAKLNVNGTNPYTGGSMTLISGQSDIEIKPIVTYLGLGYRF